MILMVGREVFSDKLEEKGSNRSIHAQAEGGVKPGCLTCPTAASSLCGGRAYVVDLLCKSASRESMVVPGCGGIEYLLVGGEGRDPN